MSLPFAYLDGIASIGPGFDHWPALAAQLRGEIPWHAAPTYLPAPQGLPPAERRRVGSPVRLALALGFEAAAMANAELTQLATVFSASSGDGDNMHQMCTALSAPDRAVSPTRFTNSVHNAPAGYWGIAARAEAPCNVLSAYDASFSMGLLEALVQVQIECRRVLLICYDTPYTGPLAALRPLPEPCGVALLFSPQRQSASLARIDLQDDLADEGVTDDAAFDALARSAPSMRALPMLSALAHGRDGRCALLAPAGWTLSLQWERCQ